MALTLQEIIDEADEKYPNSISTTSKLRKIYLHESNLLRTVFRRKTATQFDIVAEEFLYPLDFSKDKIIWVVVDGERYTYEDIDGDTTRSRFLYTYENSLGLYPTPEQTVENGIIVGHYAEPVKYTEDHLSEYPTLEPDFHTLLVYGLCVDLAELDQRPEMVNNYTSKYNGLLEGFKKSNYEPELSDISIG